jgi:glycosyltransferase involved in cell wall biosynthesis
VAIWPEVVAKVPNAVLVIAGDAGPGSRSGVLYKPTLLKAVEGSLARESIVVIQGSFLPTEYLAVENAADIVVLPYDHSTQSGVLAHAFSLGKPAIVTDAGGLMAEVRASTAGVAVTRGDRDQLKEYLVLLLSDRQLRERYALRALAYVEKRID